MATVDYNKFIHPQDRVALEALKRIPFFDDLLKAYMRLIDEQTMRGVNMASKIRLGPNQLPEIYNLLPEICATLGINEPEFYLEMNPLPNAYTFGDTNPFVVVNSGLIDLLKPDELKAVIAHECGHILCRHVLYHSLAITFLKTGISFLGFGSAVIQPIYWALMYWSRRSEFSADRVAAYVMNDCDCVVRTMMRLSGGGQHLTNKVNMSLYLKQAEEYTSLLDESKFNKLLQAWQIKDAEHPFPGIRSIEVKKWFEENNGNLPEIANAPELYKW